MAAVLEYGLRPTQPAAMHPHPFHEESAALSIPDDKTRYHPIPDCQVSSYVQPEECLSSGLDGTCERLKDNPFTRSKVTKHTSMKRDEILCDHPASPPPSNCIQADAAMSEVLDVDLNADRRKRRKITPEVREHTDIQPPETTIADDPGNERQQPQDKLQTGRSGGSLGQIVEQAPADQDSVISLPEVGPKTPRKRRGRPKQSQHHDKINDSELTDPNKDPIKQPTLPSAARSTPKKKTLSLHTNGKLLSSPTTKLFSKDPVITKSEKSTSARNFKMKNGKFVQTLEIVLRYGHENVASRAETGAKIDAILSKVNLATESHVKGTGSETHPFFLNKARSKDPNNKPTPANGNNTDRDSGSGSNVKAPIAWKDIKFSSLKPAVSKLAESQPAPWPPLSLQHIGLQHPYLGQSTTTAGKANGAKLKSKMVHLPYDENMLKLYSEKLRQDAARLDVIKTPTRVLASGANIALQLDENSFQSPTHDAITAARTALISGLSAFDRGECAGPNMWPTQYAPCRWAEVLQPSTSILHGWLEGLAIHNVKSGIDASGGSKKPKGLMKKKRRKARNELDDFIVNSDDEQEPGVTSKTAILITGPNGCGKTASVFAVAKELGFEVFEIHSGMRRSARDIFDKVGDMAHNHLVQKGSGLSRSSSTAPSDAETSIGTDMDSKQSNVNNFLDGKTTLRSNPITSDPIPQHSKREQKQSLILFEEVDNIFEEDKGFWTGVLGLIQHSKRPVVLTCNDLSSIPLDELGLYDVLTYTAVEQDLATSYLQYVAAAEGHILDRASLSALYASKKGDLRACITELNFWCQMTIGSKQGGLDWMVQSTNHTKRTSNDEVQQRIFSKDTFIESFDLVPQEEVDQEVAIKFDNDALGIAPSYWCDFSLASIEGHSSEVRNNLEVLERLSNITDARSVTDVFDEPAASAVAYATTRICNSHSQPSQRKVVASHYLQQFEPTSLQLDEILETLGPVMTEKPTFPPSTGRLAPSIDTVATTIATEITPYVRCIVNYDMRLEQQRDELFGSQGKARTTRAARAAAEGGDKANTRSERWFPKDLDFDKVLKTGGNWPQWRENKPETLPLVEQSIPCIVPEVSITGIMNLESN